MDPPLFNALVHFGVTDQVWLDEEEAIFLENCMKIKVFLLGRGGELGSASALIRVNFMTCSVQSILLSGCNRNTLAFAF